MKLCFLYNKHARTIVKNFSEELGQFSKTQNASDQIKNEIMSLFNGSDDDIDELDDEVAMISNKNKGSNDNKNKPDDALSTDDIKISIKGELIRSNKDQVKKD